MRPPVRRSTAPALLAVLTTLALLLTGCSDPAPSAGAGGPVELSVFWFGSQERASRTENALRLYSSRNPDVTFEVTWQGASGYYDRLATQAVGGNAPDLIQIDGAQLSDYAGRGLLLDLDAPMAAGRLDLDGLAPGLAGAGRVGDRAVAVPAGSETAALVYNRTLVRALGAEAPVTGMSYARLVEWADQVTTGTRGRVYGTADASGDHDALWVWLRSQGRELYAGRTLAATEDDVTRWFALWDEARRAGAAPPAAVTREAAGKGAAGDLVATGRAATAFAWSGQLAELQGHTDDELGVVAYPGDPRGQWPRAPLYWAGYRGTRHPDQVAEVLDFLANDPEAGRLLGNDRGLHPNLEVRRALAPTLPSGPLRVAYAYEDAMTGLLGPAPAAPPRGHATVRALLATAAENVRLGRDTPREAAAAFVAEASAALAT